MGGHNIQRSVHPCFPPCMKKSESGWGVDESLSYNHNTCLHHLIVQDNLSKTILLGPEGGVGFELERLLT